MTSNNAVDMPTPCRTDGTSSFIPKVLPHCLFLEPKNVRVPRVRCTIPFIRTNKFTSYSARQRQLVTVVHEELLKYKEINTEASSRYWTCKTPSMLPKKRQFSKLEYGEYWPTNTQPRLVMCMMSKWVFGISNTIPKELAMSYCSWALLLGQS